MMDLICLSRMLLGGCDAWDRECRAVMVKDANPQRYLLYDPPVRRMTGGKQNPPRPMGVGFGEADGGDTEKEPGCDVPDSTGLPEVWMGKQVENDQLTWGPPYALSWVDRLHCLVDEGNLAGSNGSNRAINSLVTAREMIRTTPTWPWSLRALGIPVNSVVLPILVWLFQYALESILAVLAGGLP